jgi:hypothetical protein
VGPDDVNQAFEKAMTSYHLALDAYMRSGVERIPDFRKIDRSTRDAMKEMSMIWAEHAHWVSVMDLGSLQLTRQHFHARDLEKHIGSFPLPPYDRAYDTEAFLHAASRVLQYRLLFGDRANVQLDYAKIGTLGDATLTSMQIRAVLAIPPRDEEIAEIRRTDGRQNADRLREAYRRLSRRPETLTEERLAGVVPKELRHGTHIARERVGVASELEPVSWDRQQENDQKSAVPLSPFALHDWALLVGRSKGLYEANINPAFRWRLLDQPDYRAARRNLLAGEQLDHAAMPFQVKGGPDLA